MYDLMISCYFRVTATNVNVNANVNVNGNVTPRSLSGPGVWAFQLKCKMYVIYVEQIFALCLSCVACVRIMAIN